MPLPSPSAQTRPAWPSVSPGARKALRGAALGALLVVTGCSLVPDYHQPDKPVPAAWDGAPQASGEAVVVDSRWWRHFDSPELSALVERSLNGNQNLQAAIARIEQARAAAEVAGAPLYPNIGISGTLDRTSATKNSRTNDIFAQASYEVDFWGKNRAQADSSRALATATQLDADTVALTQAAMVADTYFQLLTLQERLKLAQSITDGANHILSLIQIQARNGAASELQVQQQRNAVATFQAAVPALQLQLDQARHLLAVLVGQAPERFALDAASWGQLRYLEIAPDVPASVLRQRPDIQAAEARLTSANFDIDAAGWRYRAEGARSAPAARSAASPAPVPVTFGTATSQDLPIWFSGIGSMQPLNMVNVKPRVDGQLEKVLFVEGQEVHAGDVLARIDPRPFQAQLDQAIANKARDQAQLAGANTDSSRADRLARLGAGTTQSVDTFRAQVAALQATVKADQAQIDNARLNLEFCTIHSPIDGRTGARMVDAGSIIHASNVNGLVTVTQMAPIAAVFSLPQDQLPEVLEGERGGRALPVAIGTRDGSRHLSDGKLIFVDSQVDQTTGQIRLKASFDNQDRNLWPGEFISARVLVRTEPGATVVPERAVQNGQNGPYVYVIKPDGTVELRGVKVGVSVDGVTQVRSGLSPGEKAVLDGQARLAPGMRVDARRASGVQS